MHEMSIIENVIEILKKQMQENRISKLKKVILEVGQIHGVINEAMEFCFAAAVKGTSLEGAELIIHTVPLKIKCRQCHKETRVSDYYYICTHCQSRDVEITAGRELLIKSLEW